MKALEILHKHWPAVVRCVAAFAFAAFACEAAAVTCSVGTPAIDFGAYDVFSTTALASTTTLSVTCTLDASDGGGNQNVAYTIALSTGAGNSFVQRQMKNGSDSLGYNVYVDAARTQVFGDGSGASRTLSGSMRLNPGHSQETQTHTAYAGAPPQQDVAVGAYNDVLLVTVSY